MFGYLGRIVINETAFAVMGNPPMARPSTLGADERLAPSGKNLAHAQRCDVDQLKLKRRGDDGVSIQLRLASTDADPRTKKVRPPRFKSADRLVNASGA